MKVFVVSLHKAMTRSTDILLSMSGFSTMHYPRFYDRKDMMQALRGFEHDPEAMVEGLYPLLHSRQCFSDVPIPGLYRELAQRWPDSRFVLVSREPYAWARSVQSHMKERRLSPYNRLQYRNYLPDSVERLSEVSEGTLAAIHEQHTADVTRFFREELGEPQRFCHVDIRGGEVGETICRFLGKPPRPLPYLSGRPGIEDLETSREWVRLAPDKSDAHYFLATNLRYLGEASEAEKHLRAAIAAEPDQPKPYAELADLLRKRGRTEEAGRFASEAIEQGLNRRSLYRLSAACAWAAGHPARALRIWFAGTGRGRPPH